MRNPLLVLAVLGVSCHPVASIQVEPGSVTLHAKGDAMTLIATPKDERGAAVTNASLFWTNSAPDVVDSSQGKIVAKKSGRATITAAAGDAKGSTTVIVAIATSLEVSPASVPLDGVAKTAVLTAVVKDEAGAPIPGEPVEWTTSDEHVARVAGGTVTSAGPGSATITAAARGLKAAAEVRVTLPAIAGLEIEPVHAFERTGDTVQLSAKATDAAGNVVAGAPAEWSSSDPGVVAVTTAGQATAMRKGKSKVTVRIGDKAAEMALVVP